MQDSTPGRPGQHRASSSGIATATAAVAATAAAAPAVGGDSTSSTAGAGSIGPSGDGGGSATAAATAASAAAAPKPAVHSESKASGTNLISAGAGGNSEGLASPSVTAPSAAAPPRSNSVTSGTSRSGAEAGGEAPKTPTPLESSYGHYASDPVWPAPLVIDTYEFPPPLISASPGPTEAAGPAGQAGQSEAASTRRNLDTKVLATVPAEVKEDLPRAPVSLSRSSVTLCTNNEASVVSVEPIARKPLGARRPSCEALHAAAAQWPSMALPDKASRYTPPEARDATAKLAQATWDAAHKAATMGPAILAPMNQRRRVSLREGMCVNPAGKLMTPDSPSRLPALASPCDRPRIKHRPYSARAEADWQANTVMHVRRARVVCQEAQGHLMRIGSPDRPVFSRLYGDHLSRMDRFERRNAKVRPLSAKLRHD